MLDLPALLDRVHHRFPSLLIDAVGEHEPGSRLTAYKNLTINEDFFPGHFPGAPVMPAVLMIEALTQVAAVLILGHANSAPTARVSLRGVNNAKFRRQVVPGDRLMLEVSLGRRRSTLAKAQATAYVGQQRVAEAELLLAIEPGAAYVDPSANVHPSARLGEGTIVGATSGCSRIRTAASCVSASIVRTAGITGAPGKCPEKKSSLIVRFLNAVSRLPGSCSPTASIRNDGKR